MSGARRSCDHPRANHQHGTYACYVRDHCRCDNCTLANRRRQKLDAYRLHRYGPAYINADQAREHCHRLRDAGMTNHQIGVLAGVNRTIIRALLGEVPGKKPTRGVRPETARALLAVLPGAGQPAEGATCDATGSRRRLQALMAIGWPAKTLARRLGSTIDVLQVCRQDRCRSATAVAVRALYDDLWSTPGPSSQAASFYTGRGYLRPLAWDDDTIDDWLGEPNMEQQVDVDDVALTEPRAGATGRLTKYERRVAVVEMTAAGKSIREIAEAVGLTPRQVTRIRSAVATGARKH